MNSPGPRRSRDTPAAGVGQGGLVGHKSTFPEKASGRPSTMLSRLVSGAATGESRLSPGCCHWSRAIRRPLRRRLGRPQQLIVSSFRDQAPQAGAKSALVDVHSRRELAIGTTLPDQGQELTFPLGQRGGVGDVLACSVGEVRSRSADVIQQVAGRCAFDSGNHFCSLRVSHDAAAGAGPQRIENIVPGPERCEDDAMQAGHKRAQVPAQIEPAAIGEPVIQQHHIGSTR